MVCVVVVGLTAGGVVLVVGVTVLRVFVGVVVLLVDVARLVVVFVVVGAVVVAVVAWVLVVTFFFGLVFVFTPAAPPKNVLAWPLPVIERPARTSGTV